MSSDIKIKIQVRCDACGRLVTAEVVRHQEDGHGHEVWIAKCPLCGREIKAACIDVGRELDEYIVPLSSQESLAESFKHLYKLLQHVKRTLGEVEARLKELEGELRTFGVLMPDGGGIGLAEIRRALEVIWRVIPDLPGCLRCGACCGPHDWAYCEWLVITAWLRERGLKEKFAKSLFDRCPYYRPEDGLCEIYPVRPVICRLYGVAEGLECPFVEAPVILKREQACELLRLLRRIDGDLMQHGCITSETWAIIKELEKKPILMPDEGDRGHE